MFTFFLEKCLCFRRKSHGSLNFLHFIFNDSALLYFFLLCGATRKVIFGSFITWKKNLNQHLPSMARGEFLILRHRVVLLPVNISTQEQRLKNNCHLCAFDPLLRRERNENNYHHTYFIKYSHSLNCQVLNWEFLTGMKEQKQTRKLLLIMSTLTAS